MAVIGLRYPVYSPLTEDDEAGTFVYGAGKVAAKAVKVDMRITTADSEFYADDTLAESLSEFVDGAMTFTPDDLDYTVKSDWLGNEVESVLVGDESVSVLVSADEDLPGYFGFGFILPKIKDNKRMYRAVIYTKVKFSEPDESAETRGANINWQTPSIKGKLFRRIDGQWKRELTVDSLATARGWLAQELNVGGEAGA